MIGGFQTTLVQLREQQGNVFVLIVYRITCLYDIATEIPLVNNDGQKKKSLGALKLVQASIVKRQSFVEYCM